MIRIINVVDESKLFNYWTNFEGNKVTLKDMIISYPMHLDLHMNEINELLTR